MAKEELFDVCINPNNGKMALRKTIVDTSTVVNTTHVFYDYEGIVRRCDSLKAQVAQCEELIAKAKSLDIEKNKG